jgi:hypothetical protein
MMPAVQRPFSTYKMGKAKVVGIMGISKKS